MRFIRRYVICARVGSINRLTISYTGDIIGWHRIGSHTIPIKLKRLSYLREDTNRTMGYRIRRNTNWDIRTLHIVNRRTNMEVVTKTGNGFNKFLFFCEDCGWGKLVYFLNTRLNRSPLHRGFIYWNCSSLLHPWTSEYESTLYFLGYDMVAWSIFSIIMIGMGILLKMIPTQILAIGPIGEFVTSMRT